MICAAPIQDCRRWQVLAWKMASQARYEPAEPVRRPCLNASRSFVLLVLLITQLRSSRFLFIPQFATQDLADICLRQFGTELNVLRFLVSGELLLAVFHQLLDRQRGILAHDKQLDRFP